MTQIRKALIAANDRIREQANLSQEVKELDSGANAVASRRSLVLDIKGRHDQSFKRDAKQQGPKKTPIVILEQVNPSQSQLERIQTTHNTTLNVSSDFDEFPQAIDEKGNKFFITHLAISSLRVFTDGNRGRFSLSQVNELARDLILAVEALHQDDLVSCDIKDQNILIYQDANKNYYLKLIDFDLMKKTVADRFTAKHSIQGTWGYLPPELKELCDVFSDYSFWIKNENLTKLPNINAKKADVYALGVVLCNELALLIDDKNDKQRFIAQFDQLLNPLPAYRPQINALLNNPYFLGGKREFDKRRKLARQHETEIKINGEQPKRKKMGDLSILQPKSIREPYSEAIALEEAMQEPIRTRANLAAIVAKSRQLIKTVDKYNMVYEAPELALQFKEAAALSIEEAQAEFAVLEHPERFKHPSTKRWFGAGLILGAKIIAGIITSAILFTTVASPPVALIILSATLLTFATIGAAYLLNRATGLYRIGKFLERCFNNFNFKDASLLRKQDVHMRQQKVPSSTRKILALRGIVVREEKRQGAVNEISPCIVLRAQTQPPLFFNHRTNEISVTTKEGFTCRQTSKNNFNGELDERIQFMNPHARF